MTVLCELQFERLKLVTVAVDVLVHQRPWLQRRDLLLVGRALGALVQNADWDAVAPLLRLRPDVVAVGRVVPRLLINLVRPRAVPLVGVDLVVGHTRLQAVHQQRQMPYPKSR